MSSLSFIVGRFSHSPAHISALYATFGFLWFWLSDQVPVWLGYSDDHHFFASAGKGVLFVIVTGALLFLIVRREKTAMRASELLLRAVAEVASEEVYLKDRNGKYLLFNMVTTRFEGKPVESVRVLDDTKLFDSESNERVKELNRKLMATGQTVTAEDTIKSNGITRTYLSTKSHQVGEDDQVVGVFGISRDITELKQANEQAQRYSAIHEAIIGNAWEGICACHSIPQFPHVEMTVWNDQMTDLTGYTMAEINRLGWYQAMYPDPEVQEAAKARMARMRDGDNLRAELWEITRKDGARRTVSITTSVILTTIGPPTAVAFFQDVTDRTTADQAFRAAEKRFRELADAIPQIVWTAGPDGGLSYLNAKAVEYSGLGTETLLGWSWDKVIHPDDLPATVESWTESITTGIPQEMEFRIRRFDDAYRWHVTRQVPARTDDGEVSGWYGTCTDIEDIKRVEAALRESNSRLRLALSAAHLGAWDWDLSQGTVHRSVECRDIFGCDMAGDHESFVRAIHPDDAEAVLAEFRNAIENHSDFVAEYRVVRPDGEIRWVSDTGRYYPAVTGPSRIIGVMQDVTSRKRADTATRESLSRLKATLESTSDGILVVDLSGRTVDFNRHFLSIWSFPDNLVEEVRKEDLIATVNDHRTTHEILNSLIDPVGFVARIEAIYQTPELPSFDLLKFRSGQVVERYSQPQRVDGVPIGRVFSFRDVTERLRVEAAEREASARLSLALGAARMGVWEWDVRTDKVFWSPECLEITGRGETARTLTEFTSLIHPEDVDRVMSAAQQAVVNRATFEAEFRVVFPDGRTRWLANVGKSEYAPDGAPVRMVGTVQDVTERQQAESALRESERLLALVTGAASVGLVVVGEGYVYRFANEAYAEVLGLDADEIVGRRVPDLVADGWVQIQPRLDRAFAGERVSYDLTLPPKFVGKTPRHFHVMYEPRPDEHGRPTVVVVVADVTDIHQAKFEASSSREQLAAAMESMSDAVFISDSNGLFLHFNEAFASFHKFSDRQACAITLDEYPALLEVSLLDGTVLPVEQWAVPRALRGERGVGVVFRLRRRDTGETWIGSYNFGPIRDAKGVIVGSVVVGRDVTAIYHAEHALRASEERLREAVRVAGFGVFEDDHRPGSLFWSPRLREIYGVDPDAPADLNAYLSMVHPADREVISAAIVKAHDPVGNGRYSVKHRLIRPTDGRVRWLATESQTWFSGEAADRHPIRTVGATVDVTDAWEAAAALRESEERYRLLVETLPTSVHIIDGGRLTFCNQACVNLFGAMSEADLLGKTPFELVHEDYHSPVAARIENITTTREQAQFVVVKIVRLDGQLRTVHAVANPIPGGEHADTHLVCLNDITEQERSATLLRTVLGSVNDAMLTIDERGTVGTANPAALRQFGFTEDELVGRNVSMLMPEPFHKEHDEYLANYLRTGVAKVIGIGREVEGRRRDGTRFPAELTVTEFHLEGKRHFTGILRDITERKRLEAQFMQSQKMEAVGRLAGGVAHDFNNLLTVINGYSEMLLSDLPSRDSHRESVAAIRDAGERAARLTQQLLAFSRKAIIAPKVLDLRELVEQSAKLLRRLIGEDIILAVINDPATVNVKLDPGQLEQVIMNLVVNARDAMPTGGRLTIETMIVPPMAGDSTPFARLSVADTGQGMSEEVKARLFEPFFTTKEVGKGTGLGLAVVHGVVAQCGGQISVESTVGVGTTFELLFPLVADQGVGVGTLT